MSSRYSCGCSYDIDNGVNVYVVTEDCDAIEGYYPSLHYHYTCRSCADKWTSEGWATLDQQQAEADFEKACDEYERK